MLLPTAPRYKDYGARGIGVCDEWYDKATGRHNLAAFERWCWANCWKPGCHVGRIDVDGDYTPTVSYHITKLFKDAELNKETCIQKYWIHLDDGRNYEVAHYNLQVIIALGFKIDNERAVQFRKWANQIVGEYTIQT